MRASAARYILRHILARLVRKHPVAFFSQEERSKPLEAAFADSDEG